MSEASDKARRERTEARVGLASNALGIAAGTAALATAAQNPALKKPALHNAGPVTGRIVRRMGLKGGNAGRLIRAGAIGAAGLQAANLGGDIVANRVLSREATKGSDVKKSIEQSYISKSAEVKVTGRGVNIEKRYYDPEMDRQRRLGMYAGAGLAGSAGLAALGAKGIKPAVRDVEGGKVVRGLSMPKGKQARGKLALLAAAAASGAGGLAAYKRSNSRKNDPWD